MTSHSPPVIPDHPSLSTLARTTAIALVVAGVTLVTAVLPAEYGIDPVGTGRWLGLTEIAAPPLDPVEMTRSEGAPLKPTANPFLARFHHHRPGRRVYRTLRIAESGLLR